MMESKPDNEKVHNLNEVAGNETNLSTKMNEDKTSKSKDEKECPQPKK